MPQILSSQIPCHQIPFSKDRATKFGMKFVWRDDFWGKISSKIRIKNGFCKFVRVDVEDFWHDFWLGDMQKTVYVKKR